MASIGDELGPVEGFAHRAEHAAADTMRHLMGIAPHHHDAPQPAAQPPVPHNDNQEVTPVNVVAEGLDLFRQGLAKFENFDHEAQAVLGDVQSNPATAEGFQILGQLTHLPPETLAAPLGMLRLALQALGGQAEAAANVPPQQQDAGPQVGGQA